MKHPRPHCCVTVDLDTLGCYRDIHGLEAGESTVDPAYTTGVRRLLDLFEACGVDATLFVIGRDLDVQAHRDLLAEAASRGHELGNHTFSHHYDLPDRGRSVLDAEISRGEDAIEAVTGQPPVGFRAPGYHLTADVLEALTERGYRYDSSILPCPAYYLAKTTIMAIRAATGRPSRSAMTPLMNNFAPLTVYRPDKQQVWRRNDAADSPWEVPMAVVPGVRFPIIGTSLHLLGQTGFDAIFPFVRARYKQLFQLEFHAIDFMDADDPGAAPLVDHQPDLRVPWTKKRVLYHHVFARLGEAYEFVPLEVAIDALGTPG